MKKKSSNNSSAALGIVCSEIICSIVSTTLVSAAILSVNTGSSTGFLSPHDVDNTKSDKDNKAKNKALLLIIIPLKTIKSESDKW